MNSQFSNSMTMLISVSKHLVIESSIGKHSMNLGRLYGKDGDQERMLQADALKELRETIVSL